MSKKQDILSEAKQLVYGRGEKEYGHPKDNFQDEADAWSAYLHARRLLPRDKQLEPRDVAQINVLQKVMRDGNMARHDNLVDQIGYSLTAHRIVSE
jgi:hypothetical protein